MSADDPGVPIGPGTGVPAGAELVRAALDRARADAAARAVGDAEAQRRAGSAAAGARRREAGAAVRAAREPGGDPVQLGGLVDALVGDRGWRRPLAGAGLAARWAELVGAEVAEHCQPGSLVDGVLTVQAQSTAWATQLRLLAGVLLARLQEATGATDEGAPVVREVRVTGPTGPSWRHGRLRVAGPGPRDTYG